MTDTDHVLDALRLRVTPPARLMLEQLSADRGPIDLVHRRNGVAGGVVAWVTRGNARALGFC